MDKRTPASLMEKIKKVFHASPLIVIKIYYFLYHIWSKIRSFWLPVHLYKGITSYGGNSLIFSYLGWNHGTLHYWLTKIFKEYEEIPCNKLIPVWTIKKTMSLKTLNCDLTLAELTNNITQKCFSCANGFVLPRWLKMHMEVDVSLSFKRKIKEIKRVINKYSLELEKGYTCQDFKDFYENMHKPFIERRHKGSACVEDCKKMLQAFKRDKSTIYFVKKDGKRIAGMFVHIINGIPYTHAVGVLNAAEEIMRMGVIGVLYYFVLVDNKINNTRKVNIGGASPLLKDGLTSYKLSFGAKVTDIFYQDSVRLKLIPLRNTQAVKDFLTFNPFTYFKNKNIFCAIFKDKDREDSEIIFQELYHHVSDIGVKKIRVFCFNSKNQIIEDNSTEEKETLMLHEKLIILNNQIKLSS